MTVQGPLDKVALQAEILRLCRELVHPSIDENTQLIEEGLLDSFHTLKLVTHIEEAYGVQMDLSTLDAAQVANVEAIAAHVLALRGK